MVLNFWKLRQILNLGEKKTSKNDRIFIAFCDELRAYVEKHKHFPVRYTTLNNKIRYARKKINAGTLEDWKLKMFMDIAKMRAMNEQTGKRISNDIENK